MRKTKIHGIEFQLYEDIEELPVNNWNLFNEYSMLNSGVGYLESDIYDHIDRIALFVDKGNIKAAATQRVNMHQCVWNHLRGLNYDFLQLSALDSRQLHTEVESYGLANIDISQHLEYAGEKMEKFQELVQTFDQCLGQGKKEVLLGIYNQLKPEIKKFLKENAKRHKSIDRFDSSQVNSFRDPIINQLKIAFPNQFSDSTQLNYFTELKKKVVHDLRYIIEGDELHKVSSEKIQDYFISLMAPKNFNAHDHANIIMQQKLSLQKLSIGLIQRGIQDPYSMPIIRFYTSIEYFAKKN